MTITTTDTVKTHTGDGSTTDFAFPYKLYATTDLTITVDGVSNAAWSLTDTGDLGDNAGVTVRFDSAPANNAAIVMERVMTLDQQTDFSNFDGNDADVIEKAFDYLTMLVQQHEQDFDQAILLPTSPAITTNILSGTIDSTNRVIAISTDGPIVIDIADLSLSSLSVALSGAASGDYLRYDGANWANRTTAQTRTDLGLGSAALKATGASGDAVPLLDQAATFSSTLTASGTLAISGALTTPDAGELTIATGAVTVTAAYHTLDTEGNAATDDLDTISGGSDGMRITLRIEADARNVVLKHNTGNITTYNGADITLDTTEDTVELLYDGALAKWIVTSFATAGSGYKLHSIEVFTSSGTWTKPTGVSAVEVEVQGGGGGGGSAGPNANTGTAGGNSSFGSFCTGNGGSGGVGADNSPIQVGAGGAGGTGTGGDLNITGGAGQEGLVTNDGTNDQPSRGGKGGSSRFGDGGFGDMKGSSYGTEDGGKAASGYGAGGGGAVDTGAANNYSAGGGGGAGGYAYEFITTGLGATETVTVGSGGAGGNESGTISDGGAGSGGVVIVKNYVS